MRFQATYRFAEINVKITYLNKETGRFLSKYERKERPVFKIKIRQKDIDWEERKERADGINYDNAKWLYEAMCIQRKFVVRALKSGVLLFHSSVVMVDGQAYVFAAPSGTGKSTHARLWRKMLGEKVTVINDDKPFFKKEGEVWFAYGSPWNGKHGLDNNIKAPIKAICFLEQAAENEIHRIGADEAFPRLCKQIYFPEKRALCEKAVQLTGTLARLPMYLMKCNISEEAAALSYHSMKGERIE